MVKAILFSEGSSIITEHGHDKFYLKNLASLRIANQLRNNPFVDYEVIQVHQFGSFSDSELEEIMSTVGQDADQILISTSFIQAEDYNADHLGKNTRSPWSDETFENITRTLKIINKYKADHCKVLAGGFEILESRLSIKIARDYFQFDRIIPYIDYFVQGGDHMVPILLAQNANIEIKDYDGAKFIDGGKYVTSDFSTQGATPDYSVDLINPGESLMTEVAKGCIFSCQFCNYAALGKKKTDFMRSYDSLKREIEVNYKERGISRYAFADNIMNDNVEKFKWLIQIKEELGIDLKWSAYVRLDTTNPEEVQLMKDSGMIGCFFGIESFKKEVGPTIGKNTDKNKLIPKLEMFRGIVGDEVALSSGFIGGLPYETEDEVAQTMEWCRSTHGKDLLDTHILYPLHLIRAPQDRIKAVRGDPFSEYTGKQVGLAVLNWTSPWSTLKGMQEVAREDFQKRSPYFFYSLYTHHQIIANAGYDPEKVRRAIRQGKTEDIPPWDEFCDRHTQLIHNYKQKLLQQIRSRN